jgi:type II secretory pathway component PulF
MGWLASLLEGIFQWTFGILKFAEDGPWMIFSLLIAFGLLYWLMWQKKYNAQAEADENQLK